VALSNKAVDKIQATLEQPDARSRSYLSCCDKHLAKEAELGDDKLGDVRNFVRACKDSNGYTISENGRCDIGAHEGSDFVVQKRGVPRLPTQQDR
jgi:hypothetical protein